VAEPLAAMPALVISAYTDSMRLASDSQDKFREAITRARSPISRRLVESCISLRMASVSVGGSQSTTTPEPDSQPSARDRLQGHEHRASHRHRFSPTLPKFSE